MHTMQSEDMFQLNTITAITQLSYLFLCFLVQFGSYILSHPLYFSYFIFFSPYILKLLSFLSPLFITTSLFLLAFLTIQNNPYSQHAEYKVGVLDLSSYQNVLNTLSWSLDEENVDDQFPLFEEFEACMEVLNNDIQRLSFQQDLSKELALVVEEKIVDPSPCKSDAVVTLHSQPPGLTSNSQVGESPLTKQPLSIVKEHKARFEMLYSTALTPCGSIKKEKEWKRTLACKLYEERQNMNIEGSEGMDLLWESYEDDSGKVKKNKKLTNAKKEMEYDDDDDEENEVADVKLCCLQALKFSTGKMNLGMGRPNMVKISKALKGIGWFHHVSKQGKDRVK